MLLGSDDARDAINRLTHLSCGSRPLGNYLNALALDCLQAFDARAVMLFGLEGDLRIKILETFGILPRDIDALGHLHLIRPSPFSSCLSGSEIEALASDAVGVQVPGANHVLFLPISMRGAPYAGVAIWTVEDPEVGGQEPFWEAVGLATGLALTCQWMPNTVGVAVDDSQTIDLSPRQLDILILVAQGLTNREIARLLNYGLSTIGHELMAIFRALGVESREEAGREAGRRGLLSTNQFTTDSDTRLVT